MDDGLLLLALRVVVGLHDETLTRTLSSLGDVLLAHLVRALAHRVLYSHSR